MTINPEIFRAYDIRGIVDQTLTDQAVYSIGRALGTQVLAKHGDKIVIGRDGRLSGPRLSKLLVDGIIATGCNVVDVGQVPTPCLYYASQFLNVDSAVMLTGSHNPPDYNGLKIILAGTTIYGAAIQELYNLILADKFAVGQGSYTATEIAQTYITDVIQRLNIGRQLKIVIDCGNGVAGSIAPQLYSDLGCEVVSLYTEVDGNFPNHHPDPSDLHNLECLIAAVQEQQADLGLAFDGDGDRLGIVDCNGKVIWPDRALMLFVQELLKREPGATIIYDVKCSRDVHHAVANAGGNPVMWNTGHSLIKAKMRSTGALLAAEMSGHMFFKDRWYGFDDALYTGARLIEILSSSQQNSAEIFAQIPEMVSTPEISIYVNEDRKFSIMNELRASANFMDPQNIILIDGMRVEFEDGWGLVRPSNTTPKLVARFEAIDQNKLLDIQQQFRLALLNVAPELEIPF